MASFIPSPGLVRGSLKVRGVPEVRRKQASSRESAENVLKVKGILDLDMFSFGVLKTWMRPCSNVWATGTT